MRSALTIFVFPTRAHSARICRTVASFATIVTRPLRIDSCTSARAAGTTASHAPRASAHSLNISKSIYLLAPEIVDDLSQDVVQSVHRLVANHLGGLGQVGDAARRVFEARLIS